MVCSSKDMGTLEDRGASRIEMPRVGVNDAEYWWPRASSHSRGRADRLRGGEAAPRPPPGWPGGTDLPRRIPAPPTPISRWRRNHGFLPGPPAYAPLLAQLG